jgi:8-oxo-dGTP diphosphatase
LDRTERTELTVLCLIYDDDRILLQNRVKKDWQGYALPGGHVEPGESIVDAVIREMKEETGLSIHAPKLCGIKQFPIHGGRYLVFLFKTSEYSGELISSAEGKMEWIKRTELSNLETVADLPELLSVYDRDDLSEFQYVVTGEQWKVILH